MKARVRLEFRHPHQDVIDETALRQLQLTKRTRQKLRITRWETLCQLPQCHGGTDRGRLGPHGLAWEPPPAWLALALHRFA